MKKKVAFFVPSLNVGGVERVLVTYANLFSRRGYDVSVFNLTSGDTIITNGFDKEIHYYEKYIPIPHFFHAKIRDILKLNFRFRSFGSWINYHSSKYLAKKYIKDKFDIVIAFFGITTLKIVGGIVDECTKKIGWIHGGGKIDNYYPIKKYKNAVKIISSMDKIVCVSEGTRMAVERTYGVSENIFVINNPVDSNFIRKLSMESDIPQKKRFTFVNASRFDDRQKGFSRLLKVCKRLNDEGYEYDFWLIGDGIDFDKIKNLACNYKLDNIFFFGKQSNPYKFIKNADMYVCSSYSEGFSIVMIETVILATPILTTDVPGAIEMLDGGKYGMIVQNSEDGLYNGMKKILASKELQGYYKKMADLRKDYLSEEKIMNQVEEIINN